MDFIQTSEGEIPAGKVLMVGDIRFTSEDTGGPRTRAFTITYGVDGVALTVDIVDDNHLARDRLEGIREAVKAKVAKA